MRSARVNRGWWRGSFPTVRNPYDRYSCGERGKAPWADNRRVIPGRAAVVEQRNFLIEALAVLGDQRGDPRARLKQAAALYWQAYVRQGGHWPDSLRPSADDLFRRFTAAGYMSRTIATLDEEKVPELSRDLELFIELW